MIQLKNSLLARWKGPLSLGCIVAALLALSTNCNRPQADQRTSILEEQVKMLMISEAHEGFKELFKTTFDPNKTRLLLGADLQKWVQDHPRSLDGVPDELKDSIKNNKGAGLLIEGGLPDKSGGDPDVVYLRPPRFGFNRFFVRAIDPCGGSGTTCENCSGCSGESEPGGIIKSCVCTRGCSPACRACPAC
jgi:hypothetical protein